MARCVVLALILTAVIAATARAVAQESSITWTADNGNGTFSNPLFYDEFSDPDLIRVGDDFYMTGTTMRAMPGLPVLHSKDLVNWTFLSYASDQLDLGPAFRLEGGQSVYSIGRLTALSAVTWKHGWPYFGLPGNLTRTPRVWVKPATRASVAAHAPYQRSDDFSAHQLQPIWQWNHVPVEGKWSLAQRPGFLRLHSMPASHFLAARNTLSQRAIGPQSTATVLLDAEGLEAGDVAGFALLTRPYGWIGVERKAGGLLISRFDEQLGNQINVALSIPLHARRVWLRAACDFLTEKQQFSYSTDGATFNTIGNDFITAFQLRTFQGVRYALFAFNTAGKEGGVADFDSIGIHEPGPRALKPIPYGKQIALRSIVEDTPPSLLSSPVLVIDRGLGRVSLNRAEDVLTVQANGRVALASESQSPSQAFQWMATPTDEIILMSLKTHRYLRVDKDSGALMADSPGPTPDGKDGTRFTWRLTK